MKYEVHHTIRSNITGLEEKLNAEGIKLHRFQNINKDGGIFDDIMTSCVCETKTNDLVRMIDSSETLKKRLERDFNVNIVRTKIEIEPWSKLAAVCIGNQYYESHFRILGPGTAQLQNMGLLISVDKKKLHTIATLRTRRTYQHHLDMLDTAIHGMQHWQLPCMIASEINSEFVIHDDNMKHDKAWEGLEHAA